MRSGRDELRRRRYPAGLRAGNSGFKTAQGAGDVESEIESTKMSEIDPQFEHGTDDKLSKALRRLAASSQQGAPAELGAGLVTAFRRHHRRKRIRRMSIAGLVAIVILVSGLLLRRPHTLPTIQATATQTPAPQTSIEPVASVQVPEATQTASVPAEKPKMAHPLLHSQVTATHAKATKVAYSREFAALPGYDPEVPVEDLHIVRVQLPTSTLWQMGAPINPAGTERRVLADFVISRDGTPYGVRLVHTAIF